MSNKHFVHLVTVTDLPFWLSGSDIGRKGEYVWMTSGQPLNYTNWDYGEPNHFVHSGVIEYCLTFRTVGTVYKNKWNDGVCTDLNYFICDNQLWCWSIRGVIVELNTICCCNCCWRRMVRIPNTLCIKELPGLPDGITIISFLERCSLWYTSKQPRSDEWR